MSKSDEQSIQSMLLESFKEAFKGKYVVESASPKGEGHYAAVYKARDVDRGIDVAIKLFHDGTAPAGSERAWNITSRFVHPQVVPTFTIERFDMPDGNTYKAVVSRFVPGHTLRSFFERLENEHDTEQKCVAEDLASSFMPSLLDVLTFCHEQGRGHGDLSDMNIMILLTEINRVFETTAYLIDFDNESFMPHLHATTEPEKISKDWRLFQREHGIGRNILRDWRWFKEIEPMFEELGSIKDFRVAYDCALEWIGLHEAGKLDAAAMQRIFVKLLRARLSGSPTVPVLGCLRRLSTTMGIEADFNQELDRFQSQIRMQENWHHEVTIVTNGHLKSEIYKRLLP